MQIFDNRVALQDHLASIRQERKLIGLVPTMGNLHDGHLALVNAAKAQCDFVLATIFVNPLQFGENEDLENYPRTLETDFASLESSQCDAVFVPAVSEMYPDGLENQTLITVPGLSENHCGKSRPVHFGGVCTVVSKLFNLTTPDLAFFGEKDYQQLQIIKKMTRDLCFPIKIVGVPTVRTDNGLAMSSRNNYLDGKQLTLATNLYKNLQMTAQKLKQGEKDFNALEQEAIELLETCGLQVDYFNITDALTLEPAQTNDEQLVVLASVKVGSTRLIDNISVTPGA